MKKTKKKIAKKVAKTRSIRIPSIGQQVLLKPILVVQPQLIAKKPRKKAAPKPKPENNMFFTTLLEPIFIGDKIDHFGNKIKCDSITKIVDSEDPHVMVLPSTNHERPFYLFDIGNCDRTEYDTPEWDYIRKVY